MGYAEFPKGRYLSSADIMHSLIFSILALFPARKIELSGISWYFCISLCVVVKYIRDIRKGYYFLLFNRIHGGSGQSLFDLIHTSFGQIYMLFVRILRFSPTPLPAQRYFLLAALLVVLPLNPCSRPKLWYSSR